MLTVVGHREWRVLADLRWSQERGRDRAPEWRVDFKNFPESKVKSLPMMILVGPLLQGPARGGGRSGAGGAEARHQDGEQSSDGDTSEYSGSSSEEGDAPVSGGTKRDCTRQRTATPGLRDSGGGCDMAADDAPGTAATNQGRKRGTTDGGPGRRRGAGGGGGAGAADLTGAVEQGFDPRRTDGGGAAGDAGGGGLGRQQEISGGGGGGDGGAAEEMDRDGADDGGGEPCWAEMTRAQRKKWKKWGGRRRYGASPQGRASPSLRDDDGRRLPGH